MIQTEKLVNKWIDKLDTRERLAISSVVNSNNRLFKSATMIMDGTHTLVEQKNSDNVPKKDFWSYKTKSGGANTLVRIFLNCYFHN